MSINFLDIKYFIIFSLVQHSTAMVLKSPKHNTRYIKKQSKTTYYIQKLYKARKILDYNYKDWENKTSDVYDYLLFTSDQANTTLSNATNETNIQETTNIKIPTVPIESSQYNISSSLSDAYQTLPSTLSSPDTLSLTPPTNSSPISSTTSLSSSSYNTTTTTYIPEETTENIFTLTTPTTTAVTIIDSEVQSIRNQIQEAKVKLRVGYFTASAFVLLKIIESKNDAHLKPFLIGLHAEFSRLNSHHGLAMFGPEVNSIFTTLVETMAYAPMEIIKFQAKNGIIILENKNDEFKADIKSIFDVVDAIYTDEDYNNIVNSIIEIKNYPNTSQRGIEVARDALIAFLFIPHSRIQGTMKEKLLLLEIKNVVQKRMYLEGEGKPKRRNFRKYIEITNEMMASSKITTQIRNIRFTKTQIKEPLRTKATVKSSETDYTSYLKDPKIMKRLKHRMRIFKKKIKKMRMKEKKQKTRRGPTTTTTTTTTTVIPPMHKSKYYMRKYVKKNLYKMKTTTIKTTKFKWKYYGKIRKFMDDDEFEGKIYSKSNDSSDSDGYYSDSDEAEAESNEVTLSMTSAELKSNIQYNAYKNITNHILYNNIIKKLSKTKFENNNEIKKYKQESSDSNAEAYLKVNLNDALFHINNITIARRFLKKKVNKLRLMDSFSDDEAILKRNIYKVFGYTNDFSKQLRAKL